MISTAMMVKILLVSLALTLFFEAFFAYLWGIRGKRDYLIIMLVNGLTNPIVVAVYYGIRVHRLPINYGAVSIGLELFAVLTEGFFYKKTRVSPNRSFLFSLSANAFSYAMGELLNQL